MSITFPGEIVAPNKPEVAQPGGVAVSEVGGVEKYGGIDSSVTPVTNIVATSLNVSTLSSISANLGAITAGSIDSVTITGGTITGTVFRTAASGARVEIAASGQKIEIHNAGGMVMKIDDNGTDSYIKAYGQHLALSTDDNASYRVYINSNMDLNGNEIHAVDWLGFNSRSTNGGTNNTIFVKNGNLYFRDGGGNSTQLN